MDYIFNYQAYLKENKYEEFVSRGSSSQTMILVFEVEFLIQYSRGLFFYLSKLEGMGIKNKTVEEDFIRIFSTLILNIEYSPAQLLYISSKIYDYIQQAKEMYALMCEKNNLGVESFKKKLNDPRKMSFLDMINEGKKYMLKKFKHFNPTQMKFMELYMQILKSIVINFFELKTLNIHDETAYNYFTYLYSLSKPIIKGKAFQDVLKNMVEINEKLSAKLYEVKKERYGEITPTEISMSTRPGKAILVSGSNLGELEMLLEATKDKGIDIYTHGKMLSAHIYPKFKKYTHFVGHFSEELESYLVDFANFPGSILLTRHSFLNVEKFYQGRIYTTDVFSSPNIDIIEGYDFEQLIMSALRSEGFTEAIEKPPIKFDFSEKEFINMITEVAQKIIKGEIKHFFILEIPTYKMQKEYFEEILKLLGNDCFVMSFYHFTQKNKVFYVEPDYFFQIVYKAFDILTQKMSMEQLNPIILLTRCEMHSFSNVTYMKKIGIKNIYLADCLANLVNPAFTDFMRKKFNLKNYTNPKNDLEDILKKS